MPYDAVVFDLDETLMVEHASVRTAFEAACAPAVGKHGIGAAALADVLRVHARALWRTSPQHAWCKQVGISSWEGLSADLGGTHEQLSYLRQWVDQTRFRSTAWARALGELGVDDAALADHLAERLIDVRKDYHVLYPEARGLLDALHGQCRLGLLTNGAPRIQRGKIEAVGVATCFDVILVSGEAGYGKPDPRLFAAMLSRLGVAPDRAVMVGDNLAKDVGGAQSAGMRGVWINRSGEPPNAPVTPDAEIRSLAELPEWLA